MRKATPPPDSPALSQEVLRALLDLNRFARQAGARGTLAEHAQELLQYLLRVCRSSRGAMLLLDQFPQADHPFQPLALAQMREEEAHGLLAAGLASREESIQGMEGWHWLLSSIPLFQAGTTFPYLPAWETEPALVRRAPLPGSASLLLGWPTEARQNPHQDLAYRGALLAQMGDALSLALMHLLLTDVLALHPLRLPALNHAPGRLLQARTGVEKQLACSAQALEKAPG